MRVVCITDLTELEALKGDWNRLAEESPFRSWEWLSCWYSCLGQETRLQVLVVCDESSRIVGIAPFCIDSSLKRGRVMRFLGSGKACSDYMGLMVEPQHTYRVASAVASWLSSAASGTYGKQHVWELLELEGVTKEDDSVRILGDALACKSDWTQTLNSWRVTLPDSWDTYLSGLTKRARRKLRQLDKKFIATGRAEWRLASNETEMYSFYESLVRLHTLRRGTIDGDGCFLHSGFEQFLRMSMEKLFDADRLWLSELQIDGRIAANAFGIRTSAGVLLYQCGFDPDLGKFSPGWIQNIFNLKLAIALGHSHFDFLRGDEPYKKRLNGVPTGIYRVRMAAPQVLSKIRHKLWNAAGTAARILPLGKSEAATE